MSLFTEKMIQNVVFRFPNLTNINYEIEPFEKEKRIEKLRCDAIFKVKNKDEFILVEMKKNNANYSDIGQVMEYYSLLINKGYNITKVCLLAKDFQLGVLEALKYCGIEALKYKEESIQTVIDTVYNEDKEGLFLTPIALKEHTGNFPLVSLEEFDEDYADFILEEYEKYKEEFNTKKQQYLLEIWEFSVNQGGGCYLTSIKHKGKAIHPFVSPFKYMASKRSTDSSRFAVWNYFQMNYDGIPYNKIRVWTYNPYRPNRLAQSEYNETDFILECVPPKYR
jgi:hypothetical protein